jgi:hypothetical protein
MKTCKYENCEKKEMCNKFMLADDKSWDEWFKSLPQGFKDKMCEHYLDVSDDKKNNKNEIN